MKTKLLLTLIAFLCFISFQIEGQVVYSENFNINAGSFTGNIVRFTGSTVCGGTGGAMRRNLYNGATTGQLISPNTGTSLGGPTTISFDYKVANWSANTTGTSGNWGNFIVQHGNNPAGPWTDIATINQSNHTVSGSCATKTYVFSPPAGSLYIRFSATWTSGDYYLNFDNISLSEATGACSGTPAPGNTLATPGTVCSGSNVVLSTQNTFTETGITYQWQSADDVSFTTGVSNLGTNATQTTVVTANKYFRCNVSCGPNTGFSAPVYVTLNPFYFCYCPAVPVSIDAQGATNIQIGSFSNPNVSAVTYQNFTGLTPPTLEAGSTNPVTVSLQTGYSYRVNVFIDLNRDGDFNDPDERNNIGLSSNANPTSITGSIIIPITASVGLTGMRLVATDDDNNSNPCYSGSFGNVEEYLVNLAPPAPCTGVPNPGNTLAPLSVCPDVIFNLGLQNAIPGVGVTYEWQSADDIDFSINLESFSTSASTSTSLMTSRYYRCRVTCDGQDGYSNPAFVEASTSHLCNYCSAAFPNAVEPITRVTIADIDNVSSAAVNGSPPTENFASISTDMTIGQNYTTSLEGNTDGNFVSYFRVFIDFDQNESWNDAGESFDCGSISNSTGTDGQAALGSITIPETALTGSTIMRVVKRYLAFGTSCNTTGFGQAEDYTVVIKRRYFLDSDGDGFGSTELYLDAINQPSGYVLDNTDCDDNNSAIKPNAIEVCDEIDNDCDTFIDDADESITGRTTFYADLDFDSFGDAQNTVTVCFLPEGYVTNDDDCDDTEALTNPNSQEMTGNGADDNCNGYVDEFAPIASCGNIVTVYANTLLRDGPGSSDVYAIYPNALNAASQVYGGFDNPAATIVVKRKNTNIAFNWTTNGACLDATPNGVYNNNDKGIVYKPCLPVAPADFNLVRTFNMKITDQWGTSECEGRFRAVYDSPTNPNTIVIVNDKYDAQNRSITESMKLYPNPAYSFVNLELNLKSEQIYKLSIIDVLGREIQTLNFEGMDETEHMTIDISKLQSGAYIMKLKGEGTELLIQKWNKI